MCANKSISCVCARARWIYWPNSCIGEPRWSVYSVWSERKFCASDTQRIFISRGQCTATEQHWLWPMAVGYHVQRSTFVFSCTRDIFSIYFGNVNKRNFICRQKDKGGGEVKRESRAHRKREAIRNGIKQKRSRKICYICNHITVCCLLLLCLPCFYVYVYVGDVNVASCIECPIYLIKPDIKAKHAQNIQFGAFCRLRVAESPSSALCSNVYQCGVPYVIVSHLNSLLIVVISLDRFSGGQKVFLETWAGGHGKPAAAQRIMLCLFSCWCGHILSCEKNKCRNERRHKHTHTSKRGKSQSTESMIWARANASMCQQFRWLVNIKIYNSQCVI